jgi:hypothetical protein
MPPPKTWNDFLNGPVLLISRNNTNEAYTRTYQRLKDRGFTNIIHIDLPCAKDNAENIKLQWEALFDKYPIKFNQDDLAFLDIINNPNKQRVHLHILMLINI